MLSFAIGIHSNHNAWSLDFSHTLLAFGTLSELLFYREKALTFNREEHRI